MADAMVARRPPLRFYCHRCLVEFQDVEQDCICPFCDGGFIEQLEGEAQGVIVPSDDYSDADMSNIEDMNVDEMALDETDAFNEYNTGGPENNFAFIMRHRPLLRRTRRSSFILDAPPVLNFLHNGRPIGRPIGTTNGTANVTANGTANVTANGTANVTANGTANVTANGRANGTVYGTANGTANVTANVTANGRANGTVYGTANNTTNTAPNTAPNGTTTAPNGTSTAPASSNLPPMAYFNPQRGPTLIEELLWMISGGRPPAGVITAGSPFVLVGTPGDYVLGGEGLDAVVTQLLGQLEHTGPPPLPRETLAALPTQKVTAEQAAANSACSVCWENFQLDETVTRLECEHFFHQACITPWLELHATCPICRRSLLPPEAAAPAVPAAPAAPATPATAPTAGAGSTTNTTGTSATSASTTTATTFTLPNPIDSQHIRLRTPLSSLFVNTTSPHIVIQRRAGTLPTLIRRIPSQTQTWDSLNGTSTSSSISPASSVTASGVWAVPNRSTNSTGSTTNSSTSFNSSDRDRQYNFDMDFD